eukprot:CAMPEP_0206382350 /NCGR_PEP_ID=MMETSP0294-20121207/13208_1 /ASSEMBLY_ACC=CAM_ASM_000327 /TAXON_ID=39354 /ORGANISM="Heterosigma akashiwo, Strain CCMP2393" /LENGTH=298 /DNA_ID=CAMNT_0053832015 /DNA_START=38 /DNA_END=934 /DNA_ORIENTATION=-
MAPFRQGSCIPQLFLLVLAFCLNTCPTSGLISPTWTSSAKHALEHLTSPPPLKVTPLEDLANTRIPGPAGSGVDILAYVAKPKSSNQNNRKALPVIILIHEFFGLNPSIVGKAEGLAEDLGCVVVAPDTFRGVSTDFIPQAIWLALSTPQDRVNDDLDAVCTYIESSQLAATGGGIDKLAIMGFCYGGGKAMRYSTQRREDAATVVFYGMPVTDVAELQRLRAPVCGVFGRNDRQFSMKLLDEFKQALDKANIENDVRIYEGVGHAFWSDMAQVRRGEEPQTKAYRQCTDFLRRFFSD